MRSNYILPFCQEKSKLPLRGSGMMTWKYHDDLCGCGQVETEAHVYLNAIDMDNSENRWRGKIKGLNDVWIRSYKRVPCRKWGNREGKNEVFESVVEW